MFEIVKPVMSAEKIRELEPFSSELRKKKADAENKIKDIITGKDKRKLFIVGPCSADNEDAVCDYACRLAKVAEKIKEKAFVVVRVYTNKPRTRGEGYKECSTVQIRTRTGPTYRRAYSHCVKCIYA